MLNKTKAALQSCQCHYQVFNQEQNTRISAGGQSLSELHNHNSVLVGFSSNRGEVSKTYIRQWRTLAHTAKNYPHIGYRHRRYENSFGHTTYLSSGYSCSLAFFRWRRLISPFTAVTMNCAFVSPSSRLLSKSATTSCGKRALSCCDLLLVEPVAIPESPCARCDSVYAKKIIVKGLKCDSLACSFKNKGAIHLVSAKPGSASTLTGPLTTNR